MRAPVAPPEPGAIQRTFVVRVAGHDRVGIEQRSCHSSIAYPLAGQFAGGQVPGLAVVVGQLPTTTSPSSGEAPPFGKGYNDDVVLFVEGADSEISPPFGRWCNDQLALYDNGVSPTTNSGAVGSTPTSAVGASPPWDQAAIDSLMAQFSTGVGVNAAPIDVNSDGAVNLSDFALIKSGLAAGS